MDAQDTGRKMMNVIVKYSVEQATEFAAKEFAEQHDLLTMARRTIVTDASQWFCDIPWFALQLYYDPGFVEAFLNVFEDVAAWQTGLALDVGVDVLQRRGWYDLVVGSSQRLEAVLEKQPTGHLGYRCSGKRDQPGKRRGHPHVQTSNR